MAAANNDIPTIVQLTPIPAAAPLDRPPPVAPWDWFIVGEGPEVRVAEGWAPLWEGLDVLEMNKDKSAS